MSDLRYHEKHAWVREEGDELIIGISEFAQDQLGEVIFIELPEVGSEITQGDAFGSIESAKAVEDIVAPVNGVISRRNEELIDAPETVNEDPLGGGWMIAVKAADASGLEGLLSADEYAQSVG
jgi:glycine cleavage system H protein